jgi:hypothetical protein
MSKVSWWWLVMGTPPGLMIRATGRFTVITMGIWFPADYWRGPDLLLSKEGANCRKQKGQGREDKIYQ